MPIHRHALDAVTLDDVLSLDLDRGVASVDLDPVGFVDAYALTGLACFVAAAARDGVPVRLVLPEEVDVRSWLSRMHLGDVLDTFVYFQGILAGNWGLSAAVGLSKGVFGTILVVLANKAAHLMGEQGVF